ncbi:hypothetical protein [Kiloniella laminariae]|uniref:hypothetical protein n=1 Tax=Kiloniella laminariae TaxID=454162 RepID=UPI0003A89B9D|nr:hypothetical protein [Kiloniella laminariae]
MDLASKEMVEEAYFETVTEALSRSESLLTAHKEGVTAAAMLLAAMTGTEEDDARREVVALDLRPQH